MSRLRPLVLLLLAVLWLPASMHCQLEGAEVEFLTHADHLHSDAHHDHGTGEQDEHHAFKDTPYTTSTPAIKVLPPGDSLSVVLLALLATGRKEATQDLSPERHPPPPALRVAWQFLSRAAPPARAPNRA